MLGCASVRLGQVAIIVQGLFEKSDSIGYDAVFEYNILKKALGEISVRLFAEKFDQSRYPDVKISSIEDFYSEMDSFDVVVYHFCDGWNAFDQFVAERKFKGRAIVRWHNNTPPWFYAPYDVKLAERCVRGFENIRRLAQVEGVEFWVNSQFTARQLVALGGQHEDITVVYPGSRYATRDVPLRVKKQHGDEFRMLFVGRVVAHKGHLHCIALAEKVSQEIGRPVRLDFVGRKDASAGGFNAILEQRQKSVASGVTVNFSGEVTEEDLNNYYNNADVFVCLSEHEGFGLPVFEAMLCGVPVVACTRTAMTELLSWHPLTIPEMDTNVLAKRVASVLDPKTEASIVETQLEIAKQYTLDLISRQMMAGLQGQAGPLLDVPAPLEGREVAKPTFEREPLFDFGENYVTTYDIAALRAALEADGNLSERLQSSYASSPLSYVELSPKDFRTIGGTYTPEGIQFPLTKAGGHAVYGPYVRIPNGDYEATFLFKTSSEASNTSASVDVVADGGKVLVARRIKLNESAVVMKFSIRAESDIIEFRVGQEGNLAGPVVFTGLRLARDGQIAQLVAPSYYTNVRPNGGLLYSLGFGKRARHKKASEFFKQADSERDSGNYNEAAKHYRKGLELNPIAKAYWVQLGNMLKDTRRPIAAIEAYDRAASLSAPDADLLLQMSMAYEDIGDLESSASYRRASLEQKGQGYSQ